MQIFLFYKMYSLPYNVRRQRQRRDQIEVIRTHIVNNSAAAAQPIQRERARSRSQVQNVQKYSDYQNNKEVFSCQVYNIRKSVRYL